MEKNREKGSDLQQILCILTVSLLGCTTGTLFAWTSPSIPILISDDYPTKITLEEASYLIIVPTLGNLLACPILYFLLDKIGRKTALCFAALPYAVCWIVVMFSSTIYEFYISRFIFGIMDCFLLTVIPAYISEISTPNVRGSWGNTVSLSIYFGQFLVNFFGAFCSIRTTAYILVFIPIVFVLLFLRMPESPYYLMMARKEEDARDSLKKLRGKNDVEEEFRKICENSQRMSEEKVTFAKIFGNRTNRNAVWTACFLRAAQTLSGVGVFSTYTAYFFQQAGSDISYTAAATIYNLLLTIMSVASSIILDKLGRRLALNLSTIGCGLVLLSLSTFFYVKDYTSLSLDAFNWFPLLCLCFYVIFFSIGIGLVPLLMVGELLSPSIKIKASCFIHFVFMACISATSKMFQVLTSSYGLSLPLLIFGVSVLIISAISYCIVPETKGKTLEEIQLQTSKDLKN